MYTIAKRFSFSASHQLQDLEPGHPCMRMHGHNYEVELILQADVLNDSGFVVDYHALRPFADYINENLDHKHLNDWIMLQDYQPSAENIAHALFLVACRELVDPVEKPFWVVAVRVSETPKTWAEYRPGRG